jgi:hypothetical protein
MSVDPASMPSPDMDDVDENFHQDLDAVRNDVRDVYDGFAKLDPSFMQQPAVEPTDSK